MSFDVADLSPQQLADYKAKRTSYFKGTIAVACIYGTLALVMFLIAIFSPTGKAIITDQMLPFTIAFIGGMIIVVILMLVAIFSTTPPPKTVFAYDNTKCPDYWTLQQTPSSVLNGYDGAQKAQLAFRCVNPNAGNNINTLKQITVLNPSTDKDTDTLLKASSLPYQVSYDTSSGSNRTGYLNCNVVYPDYLNYHDMQYKDNNELSPNRIRCKYANKCEVSWASACPNKTS